MAEAKAKTPRKMHLTARQIEALSLRNQGKHFLEIAAIMEIDVKNAHKLVTQALVNSAQMDPKTIEEQRTAEVCRIEETIRKAWEIVNTEKVAVVTKDGEIVLVDPDPELVLKAIDRVQRGLERRAKLLGVEMPQKSEHDVKGPWMNFLADVVKGDGGTG